MSGTTRAFLGHALANVRELGGLPTTTGGRIRVRRLMRANALVELAPEPLEALLSWAPRASYVDLRTREELERDGRPTALVSAGWQHVHLPLGDTDPRDRRLRRREDFLRHYLDCLPKYLECVDAIARLACESPVVVACSAGKDRTGFVTAVLLGWLGVPRAAVVEDFVLSNQCLRPPRNRMLAGALGCSETPPGPVDEGVLSQALDAVPDGACSLDRGLLQERLVERSGT